MVLQIEMFAGSKHRASQTHILVMRQTEEKNLVLQQRTQVFFGNCTG